MAGRDGPARSWARSSGPCRVSRACRLDPRPSRTPPTSTRTRSAWLTENLGATPVLMYSSAAASERGPADPAAAAELERMMGGLGRAAVALGRIASWWPAGKPPAPSSTPWDQRRARQCRNGHRGALVQHRRRRPGHAAAEIRATSANRTCWSAPPPSPNSDEPPPFRSPDPRAPPSSSSRSGRRCSPAA